MKYDTKAESTILVRPIQSRVGKEGFYLGVISNAKMHECAHLSKGRLFNRMLTLTVRTIDRAGLWVELTESYSFSWNPSGDAAEILNDLGAWPEPGHPLRLNSLLGLPVYFIVKNEARDDGQPHSTMSWIRRVYEEPVLPFHVNRGTHLVRPVYKGKLSGGYYIGMTSGVEFVPRAQAGSEDKQVMDCRIKVLCIDIQGRWQYFHVDCVFDWYEGWLFGEFLRNLRILPMPGKTLSLKDFVGIPVVVSLYDVDPETNSASSMWNMRRVCIEGSDQNDVANLVSMP